MAVDRIVERDGREAPCRTDEIPLGAPVDADSLPEVEGVDDVTAARTSPIATATPRSSCCGSPRSIPRSPAGSALGLPDIAAEAAYAAGHEQAHTVGDVLLRRTRLGLLDARRSPSRTRRPACGGPGDGRRARLGRRADRAGSGGVARACAGGGTRSRSWMSSPCAQREPEEPSPAAPGAAPGGGRVSESVLMRGRELDLVTAGADGHRERDPRLVLGPPGPEGARRAGRTRARTDRGRRGDRGRGRRVRPHGHRGRCPWTRRSRGWSRWWSAWPRTARSCPWTPGADRWRARRSRPVRR